MNEGLDGYERKKGRKKKKERGLQVLVLHASEDLEEGHEQMYNMKRNKLDLGFGCWWFFV